MEQWLKDTLQMGFSFFVAIYLLLVQSKVLNELSHRFTELKEAIVRLCDEIRYTLKEMDKRDTGGIP